MKAILLLAALHILIMYQSKKKHSKENNVLPAPTSVPTVKEPVASKPVLEAGAQSQQMLLSFAYGGRNILYRSF